MTTQAQDKVTEQTPDTIALEEIEILRLENMEMKINILEQEAKALFAKRAAIKESIEERLGISNLGDYIMDVKTGKGKLAKGR